MDDLTKGSHHDYCKLKDHYLKATNSGNQFQFANELFPQLIFYSNLHRHSIKSSLIYSFEVCLYFGLKKYSCFSCDWNFTNFCHFENISLIRLCIHWFNLISTDFVIHLAKYSLYWLVNYWHISYCSELLPG